MGRKIGHRTNHRQDWMRDFETAVAIGQPYPADYWDTATHLYIKGLTAKAAAARYVKALRGENDLNPFGSEQIV